METELIENDYAKCKDFPEIIKVLEGENLLFSENVIKINRKGDYQERMLLITNKKIYNFKKRTLQRKIPINCLLGITVSSKSDEFVFHGTDIEYDYHYISKKKRNIILIISKQYYIANSSKILLSVIDKENLKEYVTLKKEKKNYLHKSNIDLSKKIDIDKYLFGNITKDKKDDSIIWNLNEVGSIMNPMKSELVFNLGRLNARIRLEHFKIQHVLSYSIFGQVSVVQYVPTGEYYLMRSLKNNNNSILDLGVFTDIAGANNPFIESDICIFKNEERIYIVSDFKQFFGGYLYNQLDHYRVFDNKTTKVYAAEIAIVIDFLHQKGLKCLHLIPENFLLNSQGHIVYINYIINPEVQYDEDIIKYRKPPEFIAPEFYKEERDLKNFDWYTFGVIIYEMLVGIPPFFDNKGKVKYPIIIDISDDAKDIIDKLLKFEPNKRLGSERGIEEIKEHKYFSDIDFKAIYQRKVKTKIEYDFSSETNPYYQIKYFDSIGVEINDDE